jgi:hypothetical protein
LTQWTLFWVFKNLVFLGFLGDATFRFLCIGFTGRGKPDTRERIRCKLYQRGSKALKIQGFPGRGLHFGGNEDRIQLTRPNAGKHMMDTIGEAIVSIVLAIVSIVPSYSVHCTEL